MKMRMKEEMLFRDVSQDVVLAGFGERGGTNG